MTPLDHQSADSASGLERLRRYLVLPPTVSKFEDEYLARMNRIALRFLYAHLPLLPLLAWFKDSGPAFVAGLTAFALAGSTLAYSTLSSRRHVSQTLGFTAMCMGGILLHAGQGPLQIEMHFYFFALMAMGALFANPMVIITAAATVVVHHSIVWVLAPASVFNYVAPWWVVAVHAGFILFEAAALCFIARTFFDYVIGLDRIVRNRTDELEERNRDVRLILDHVNQALLTVDREGTLSVERSALATTWFGPPESGEKLWDIVGRFDARQASWLEVGWTGLTDDFLPIEVVLDQLPKTCTVRGRVLALEYRPIEAPGGELERLLVVMTDETDKIEAGRMQALQREVLGLFQQILNDRAGFLDFYREATALVRSVTDEELDDPIVVRRALHTLKGNASIVGLDSIAAQCHTIEDHLDEGQPERCGEDLGELKRRWGEIATNVDRLIGEDSGAAVTVSEDDFESLLAMVAERTDHVTLARRLVELRMEPTLLRLERLAADARRLAERLEKGEVEVDVEDGGLRLTRSRFNAFWSSVTHVLRNAVDHGLEPGDERERLGKDRAGRIRLSTFSEADELVVEIADDGRGIDWDAVRLRAEQMGVATPSTRELERALFTDGLSTRTDVTAISGRGVGLAAVLAECEALDGHVAIHSAPGRGTRMQFRFPDNPAADELRTPPFNEQRPEQ